MDSPIETTGLCPFCRTAVDSDASKCPNCQSVIGEYIICPDCRESASSQASVCRHCGHRFEADPAGAQAARDEILCQVWADCMGAMITEPSLTALFFPPVLTVTAAEVRIQKWSFWGLRTYRQRLSTERIASVRFLKGIFWGGIVIETYGGSSADLVITGLRKNEAQDTAELLEKLAAKSFKK